MSANNQDTKQNWVDPDDAPELTGDFFEHANEYVGDKLINRGRPRSDSTKVALTIRYDADIIESFKAAGKGWQTRMNNALRDWLKNHSAA
jgi:hypothetical protein